jgi:pyrroline-5-carboxylate reductase
MLQGKKIGFIGGGNMAEALIRGLLAGGVTPSDILVAEPLLKKREYLVDRYHVQVTGDNRATAGIPVVILAIKPQVAAKVLVSLAEQLADDTLLVSIMAGTPCAAIEATFPNPVRVVRVMPNTPALVMAGASAICRGSHATDEDIELVREIFTMTGTCSIVGEVLMDAVTGLSGSGPAYVMTFVEALSDAGVKNGLPREVATELAIQTVLGTARLLQETGEHPAALRDKVTSPGGTTIAGLHALEKGAFRATVMNAVDAAAARARELGK